MKYKHYSPNAHVIIVKGDFDKFASLVAEPRSERTCAVCFDGEEDKISVPAYPYGHADSPEEQARELFDVLRHVDDEKWSLPLCVSRRSTAWEWLSTTACSERQALR